MDEDLLLDAKLSKAVYTQEPQVGDWKLDKSLSNQNRSVYYNPQTKKARVAFRGTDLTNKKTRWDDIGTDILVGLGLQDLSNRMKAARKTTDLAVQKYGKNNVTTTGHSLGGTQSMYVNRKTGVKGTGFNAGVTPIDTLTKRRFKGFTNVTTDGDLISNWGRSIRGLSQVKRTPKDLVDRHSIIQFVN